VIDSYESFLTFGRKVLNGVYGDGYDIEKNPDEDLIKIYNRYAPDYTSMIRALKNMIRSDKEVQKDIEKTVVEIIEDLSENPTDRTLFSRLEECMASSTTKTVDAIISHSAPLIKIADLNETFQVEKFRNDSFKMKMMCNINTPEQLLDLMEALYSMVVFAARDLNESSKDINAKTTAFLESVNYVYSTYKNSINEYLNDRNNTEKVFSSFLDTLQAGYYFTPEKISMSVSNIPYFMYLNLSLFDKFVSMNETFIASLFGRERIAYLKNIYNTYADYCGIVSNYTIAEEYINFAKLYEAYDLALSTSKMLGMQERKIVIRYLKYIKAVIDEVRKRMNMLNSIALRNE